MPKLTSKPISIVIADPKALVRQGLRIDLQRDECLDVIAEAESCEEALHLVETLTPAVLIADFFSEGQSLLELISAVCSRGAGWGARTEVLVFSASIAQARILGAMTAGARGYLLKSESTQRVAQGVKQIVLGQTVVSQFVQDTLVSLVASQHAPITSREKEIFRLLAYGHADADIATDLGISEHTVRLHVQHICRKLPFVRSRAEATAWAWINQFVS